MGRVGISHDVCGRPRRTRRMRVERAGHTDAVGFVGRVGNARDGQGVWDDAAWRVCVCVCMYVWRGATAG